MTTKKTPKKIEELNPRLGIRRIKSLTTLQGIKTVLYMTDKYQEKAKKNRTSKEEQLAILKLALDQIKNLIEFNDF